MRPVLVFDIETVPDVRTARRSVGASDDLSDAEVLARLAPPKKAGETFGFLKPLYHQIVEVSVCVIGSNGNVAALMPLGPADESAVLSRFWSGFGRQAAATARIVTFNGRHFDVPVLTQRALLNDVSPAPIFTSDYRKRFKDSHIDLMEVISDYGSSTALSQHEMAVMLRIPGKVGVDGGDVGTLWARGKQDDIAAYCTCDVATLALGYARIGIHVGWCSQEESTRIEANIKEKIEELGKTHKLYRAFLKEMAPTETPEKATGTEGPLV